MLIEVDLRDSYILKNMFPHNLEFLILITENAATCSKEWK